MRNLLPKAPEHPWGKPESESAGRRHPLRKLKRTGAKAASQTEENSSSSKAESTSAPLPSNVLHVEAPDPMVVRALERGARSDSQEREDSPSFMRFFGF